MFKLVSCLSPMIRGSFVVFTESFNFNLNKYCINYNIVNYNGNKNNNERSSQCTVLTLLNAVICDYQCVGSAEHTCFARHGVYSKSL